MVDQRVKTKLLLKLNRRKEAKISAEMGLISAKKEQRAAIIKEFEHILEALKK